MTIIAALTVGMTSCASAPGSISVSTSMSTPTLTSIMVTPNPSTDLMIGSVEQFTAVGHYSDGSSSNITSQATWNATKTNNTPIANISSGGIAIGVAAGSSEITAFENSITSSAVALIVVATSSTPIIINTTTTLETVSSLSTIIVKPASPADISIGATQQFTATGIYSDGSTADINSQVTWESDKSWIATIQSNGIVMGEVVGTADITATLSGITRSVSE